MKKSVDELHEDAMTLFAIASTVLVAAVFNEVGVSLWVWFLVSAAMCGWAWWKFWKATA